MTTYLNSLDYARYLDETDELRHFRAEFLVPERDGQPLTYLCGNSLGLQPRRARQALERELMSWQQRGVEGWFEGDAPWLSYHRSCQEPLARLVGARPAEVCPMNNLTVNLHLMLTTFYRPTGTRTKILTLAGDFPSDQYALETHVRSRGLDPAEVLVEVPLRAGEFHWREADLLQVLDQQADTLALVVMSGLHYYNGQVLPMQALAQKARALGIPVGFDLAHAVGNVPLHLHHWDVDFAVWCSYKYLNAGPGGVAGLFVHEKHHKAQAPRLAGWWGYDEARRFEMTQGFVPMPGAAGWQLSTPAILPLAVHRAALGLFEEAGGMERLREKSLRLTGYLEFLLQDINQRYGAPITLMTPPRAEERGCQLSWLVRAEGKVLFDYLGQRGIVGDWREPNCIRLAPAPLYNTFEEVWRVGEALDTFYAASRPRYPF
ncbi:kynureninase [Rhabdobacter roseus]|uniref:Kynureninase n=1 Tax=Rhabdobacter roseus TaxID=1655419 RepID=A0A840TS38_9BACT|nr:kynureninase [Rhabdobacter roseus]MBB5285725.1 kynureninase [Rhabdobacter roseus]